MPIRASRAFLWLILAVPGIVTAGRWMLTPHAYGFGHAIGDTGDWAAWLLMITLAVTPVRLLFRGRAWTAWLVRHRRDLGVASFAYAAFHTGIYVMDKASLAAIADQFLSPDMLLGWLALALFAPLAVTSNDVAVRALRRSWKRLHRLVYPAAAAMFAHWALAAFDPVTAYLHIAGIAVIELVRLWLQYRQRVT